MTLWRRAPRSVYQVYDEEQYLAGPKVPGSERIGPDHESQAPASGLGQIDPGYPHAPGALPGAYARQESDRLAERSTHRTSGRVLALSLLSVVTAGATGLVALEVSRHSAATPPPVSRHRAPARELRSAMPAASASASIASSAIVPAQAAPHRRAVVMPAEIERTASSPAVVPSRRVDTPARSAAGPAATQVERPAEAVDAAGGHPGESPSMATESQVDESQVDSEFGFER
jgi:hypothetical protein